MTSLRVAEQCCGGGSCGDEAGGEEWRSSVLDYYRGLESNDDLKTSACCTLDSRPSYIREIISKLSDEVKSKYYGCGSPIPAALSGARVLDLASGCGHDAFILSSLVGEAGSVVGIDLLEEHVEIARSNIAFHQEAFGYRKSNVEFVHGLIEDLSAIESESVDVVTSNCAINLSPDKRRVFSEALRVLKPGGQLYFSDIFTDRRVPEELQHHPMLRGECLTGALYLEDFRRILTDLGVPDVRMMEEGRLLELQNDVRELTGGINFYSYTASVFKLGELMEDRCEDYGQAVRYEGTIKECPEALLLDDHHLFQAGKWYEVCGNTEAMLSATRFSKHFEFQGSREKHFGLFECAEVTSPASAKPVSCC